MDLPGKKEKKRERKRKRRERERARTNLQGGKREKLTDRTKCCESGGNVQVRMQWTITKPFVAHEQPCNEDDKASGLGRSAFHTDRSCPCQTVARFGIHWGNNEIAVQRTGN